MENQRKKGRETKIYQKLVFFNEYPNIFFPLCCDRVCMSVASEKEKKNKQKKLNSRT